MAGRVRRQEIQLWPQDNGRLSNLCGQFDEHLKSLEECLGVHIRNRGHRFWIAGSHDEIVLARRALEGLYRLTEHETLDASRVNTYLGATVAEVLPGTCTQEERCDALHGQVSGIQPVRPMTTTQADYLAAIQCHDVVFGEGPAGTGKTFLAVAAAVTALQLDQVERIVLARPAVEAGEHLGFLPGDLAQKVDPYLRPLFDALTQTLGAQRLARLLEQGLIEVAPLAFMRGRTLSRSFVILDEAQNTTIEQMKMFLTRLGQHSKAVVAGDVSQVDLLPRVPSGLSHALAILEGIGGVAVIRFGKQDVRRHALVQRILTAYEYAKGAEREAETRSRYTEGCVQQREEQA